MGKKIGSLVIKQWAKKEAFVITLWTISQLDKNVIQENIQKAYKLFHQLKKDLDWHDSWIAGIIQAQALAKGVSTKALWKQHRTVERAQNTARIVWLVLQTSNQQGALHAVWSNTQGPLSRIYNQIFAEEGMSGGSRKKFSQANNTPLLQATRLQWFGEIRTNQLEFKKVLAGKSKQQPKDDIYTTKLLQHLSQPPHITDIPPRSLQEYTTGWCK